MEIYHKRANISSPAPHVPTTLSVDPIERLGASYGIGDEMVFSHATNEAQSVEQEYQAYITEHQSAGAVPVLTYWKVSSSTENWSWPLIKITHQAHKATYPTLHAMAMDYLPIQASSVSCERVFSSSSETDTKKRNRINGLLMEALQMLKFSLKKDRLSTNERFSNTTVKEMTPDDLEMEQGAAIDLLADLMDAGSAAGVNDALDRAIRATADDELEP